MAATSEDARVVSRFIIECIEKSDSPKDMNGDYWYRYIVRQNKRIITGFKAGTLKSVTEHVESFTEGLNERSVGGVSPNARSTRGKK
jgi:hypothetical protein